MEITPEADEAITRAKAFVANLGLDLGPVEGWKHVTKALLREQLRNADPNDPAYETGVGLFLTMRDHWAIRFAKKLPEGVVECPSSVCVVIFDDTGEVELS